jgi:outer membrane protein assembly factor BamE (lipoprotein component of BamABCDE complex)
MSGALDSIEVWLIALAATVAILAGFGLFSRWCSFSPAAPRRKLEQLRVGMSRTDVRNILGPPRDAMHVGDGPLQWVYGSRLKRHVLIIEFNGNEMVTSFAHGVPQSSRRGSFSGR